MEALSPMQGQFVIPEVVVTHFHLRPGDEVADFGFGRGYFVPIVSELVGAKGRVYACEIQKTLVDTVSDLVRTQNLTNVEVLWCDIEAAGGNKLKEASVDVVLLVNTLFQLEDKAAAIAESKRVLRPGGRLFVVDWSESFGGLGPQPEHVIEAAQTQALCETAGLVFERSYEAGDHHYGHAYRNP